MSNDRRMELEQRTKVEWKGIAKLPKDNVSFDSPTTTGMIQRFYDALVELKPLNRKLAIDYANAYNRLLDGLPKSCECMYIYRL